MTLPCGPLGKRIKPRSRISSTSFRAMSVSGSSLGVANSRATMSPRPRASAMWLGNSDCSRLNWPSK